ncbi:hypothetical protein OEZ85_006976 [Tetradesmus obliquus]|uniref:EamA domain-containing protein n=1 Tax=Tetradesmus obliquus TaxID=3088 RepID=A0ABY8U0C1_TETOB|nr:hypothetical protein OEZ85_006976 [Tetradesmus obliquus]
MRASVVVLSLCMLFTGTINTIATKYQDITVVGTLPDGTPLTFKHPAVQSACMFFGESLCLIPYFIMRWRKRKAKRRNPAYVPMHPDEKRSRRISRILAFAVPTLCDAMGTTLMNVGLIYTYASTYQMLRGTLVLFAGTFTILILRRQLFIHNWLGMVLITAGAALVGASSVIYQDAAGAQNNTLLAGPAAGGLGGGWLAGGLGGGLAGVLGLGEGSGADVASAPLFGDMLVVAAQMFTALQFIMEEKFLVKYKVPALLAVGLEGCWGLLLCCFVLPVTTLVRDKSGMPLDDAVAAVRSILSDSSLGFAVYSSILSIAFFNFFGVSVTKSLSGAARATIDACRTLFIWLYALHAGWEHFHALQVVGFVVLLSGTSLYNEILKSCLPGFTLVTEHEQQAPPRRRSRQSAPAAMSSAADGPELSAPLLPAAGGSSAAAAAAAAAPPSGRRAGAPMPLRRPAPAHERVYDAAQSTGGSGSWVYTMARSMRLGIHALSPQSLAAVGGGLGGGDDEESGGESDIGSYTSSAGGGLLAASLGRGDGSLGGGGGGGGGGAGVGLAGHSPVQAGERGRVVIGFGTPNSSRAAAGRLSPLAPQQQQQQQGGLSASLRVPASGAAAAASAAAAAGAAGAAAEGAAGGMRRSSSAGGLARSAPFGNVPRPQQPAGGRGSRPPPTQ